MIEGIASKNIDVWWEHVEEYLISALEYGLGEYSIEDIKKSCKDRSMQLWVKLGKKVEGAFVTEILNYPQKNILVVLLLGGENFQDWVEETVSLLVAFGKEKKCSYVELFGRKGWTKTLQGLGFEEKLRIIVKEI